MVDHNGWHDLQTNVGGKEEAVRRAYRPQGNGVAPAKLEPTLLEKFFGALERQWRPYDMLFHVTNPIRPGQDPQTARSAMNEILQTNTLIIVDALTRKYAGFELFVLPRAIGGGAWTMTPAYEVNDASQLQDVVGAVVTEMPTLVPGMRGTGVPRALAVIGSGGENLLMPFANGIHTELQPVKWGWCFGGDRMAHSARAFLIVSMTGMEMKQALGHDGPPPPAIIRWLKRIQELWERTLEKDGNAVNKKPRE
ncbi:MAG: hypothetical protein HY671_04160 [Chloroflexi bacterium]|nr:hypothetical protein [Chloroflexota bacterium]